MVLPVGLKSVKHYKSAHEMATLQSGSNFEDFVANKDALVVVAYPKEKFALLVECLECTQEKAKVSSVGGWA